MHTPDATLPNQLNPSIPTDFAFFFWGRGGVKTVHLFHRILYHMICTFALTSTRVTPLAHIICQSWSVGLASPQMELIISVEKRSFCGQTDSALIRQN